MWREIFTHRVKQKVSLKNLFIMDIVYIMGITLSIAFIGYGIFFLSSKGVYQVCGIVIALLATINFFLIKDYNPARDEFSSSDYAYKPSVNTDIIPESIVESDTIEAYNNDDHDVDIDPDDPDYIDIEDQDDSDIDTDFTFIEEDGRGGPEEYDYGS